MMEPACFTLDKKDVFGRSDHIRIMPYCQEDLRLHNHRFFELVYIIEGSAYHTLAGQTVKVGRGDYFIVDYGSSHDYSRSSQLKIMNCLFLPELIDQTLSDCRSIDELMNRCLIRYYKKFSSYTPADQIFKDEDGKVFQLLLDMQQEYEERLAGADEVLRGKLLEIFILTMRKLMVVNQNQEICVEDQQSDMVLQLLAYLKGSFHRHSLLADFSLRYHYNSQYVSRRFKQETGCNISEYVQRLRVAKSCELLTGSSLSIEEISRAVGYEDVKFYNQLFRRLLHLSPREYRKMTQKSKNML